MLPDLSQRLNQQLQFIIEIDKLKTVLRRTLLIDSSRLENSAEHSWHIATMAIFLAEYAPYPVNILHVIKMLLIHDIVEIDAGDTFCYDADSQIDKSAREIEAANRLFNLLPEDQSTIMRALWDEFEAQQTPEAQFAASLDRIQPFLHNQHNQGGTWRLNSIKRSQVLERMAPVKKGAPALWDWFEGAIEECVRAGYLKS